MHEDTIIIELLRSFVNHGCADDGLGNTCIYCYGVSPPLFSAHTIYEEEFHSPDCYYMKAFKLLEEK